MIAQLRHATLLAVAAAFWATATPAQTSDVNVVNVPTVRTTGIVITRPTAVPQPLNYSGDLDGYDLFGRGTGRMVISSMLVSNVSNGTYALRVNGVQASGPNCTGTEVGGSGPSFTVVAQPNSTQQLVFPAGLVFPSPYNCILVVGPNGMVNTSVMFDGFVP